MFINIFLKCSLFCVVHSLSEYPILIVLSYDAFRYDYFSKSVTPHMLEIRKQGSYAKYMINVFPTKTFPNHHSIATGFYPEAHGVVDNSFYDPKTQKVVNFGYDMFHYNDNILPIWIHNEDYGPGRYSGSMMWPGGSFPYQGKYPTYYKKYTPGFNWFERIDTVLSWIENPDKPANLVMVYFEEPDTHGHAFGPDSKNVMGFLEQLDNITMYLEEQLSMRGLKDKVNVIHLSDHGMSTVKPPGFIDIKQFLPESTYKFAGSSPCVHIIPNEGFEDDIYSLLLNASKTHGHFKMYTKKNMPARWRYKNNPRIPPILLVADSDYGFQDLAERAEDYSRKYHFTITNESQFGVHGYDPKMREMRPFFMARGPQIKVNHEVSPFRTVDLFNLFGEILQIKRVVTDGTFANVEDVLVGYRVSWLPLVVLIAGGSLLVMLLILCAAVVTLLIIKRQQNITTAAALNKRFPQNFKQSNIEAQHLLDTEDA